MFRCPYCGAVDVRRSHFRWLDWVKSLLLMRPCKCTSCKRRFSCYWWQI